MRLAVESGDLRRKVRTHRSPFAVVFVVDNSYSIHADQMVERVKGLALELLEDATARGDRVALVCFKGGVPEGTVALPLTRSMAQAHQRLAEIPLSGRTPLADALRRARLLLRQEVVKHRNAVPVLVLISDCLPTVPLRPGGDPLLDLLGEARRLRTAKVVTVVADAMPPGGRSPSAAPQVAEAAGGVCIPFAELAPGVLKGFLAAGEEASLGRRGPR
ncbi:MAG: VWA domain-containing protein [Thermoleophilia bacterium]